MSAEGRTKKKYTKPAELQGGQELADTVVAAMDDPGNEQKRKEAAEGIIRLACSIAATQGAGSLGALQSLAAQIDMIFSKIKPVETKMPD